MNDLSSCPLLHPHPSAPPTNPDFLCIPEENWKTAESRGKTLLSRDLETLEWKDPPCKTVAQGSQEQVGVTGCSSPLPGGHASFHLHPEAIWEEKQGDFLNGEGTLTGRLTFK